MLVPAVVIHRPDFLVPAAGADEGDLSLGDTRQAAAQPRDDIVGKLVRQLAGIRSVTAPR